MTGIISAKYAFRSLFRHTRRTILSIIGIGVGCGLGLFAISWILGEIEWQIKAIAQSGSGHIKIVPAGWTVKRLDSLRLNDWQKIIEAVQVLPGVEGVTARSRVRGLLAFGNRTAGAEITGVEPDKEPALNRIIQRGTLTGRYLQAGDKGRMVIGAVLARRLDVEVGDDLVLTVAGKKDIQSAMLRIVGIIATGSKDIDLSVCQVTMDDIESITGYEGASEAAVLLHDHKLISRITQQLQGRLPEGSDIISWQEVRPDMTAGIEGDKAYTRLLVGVIIIIVAFGIASAQLAAVLERRKEFAILMALGMKSRQIVALIVMEAFLVGLGGALAGLILGGSCAYYISTAGVNFESFIGDLSLGGNIMIDYVFYGEFGLWLVWTALLLSIGSAVIASIYPAWYAAKADPAAALRTV